MLTRINSVPGSTKIEDSNLISVVLLTKNTRNLIHYSPYQLISSIPKEVSKEIIVVHYNSTALSEIADNAQKSNNEYEREQNKDTNILHVWTENGFAVAVRKGIEASVGKFILVIDADHHYSRNMISEVIKELTEHPNFIIVASRYVPRARMRKVSFLHNIIHKAARFVSRHALQVKNVEDPLSTCFAFSRHFLNEIRFEGKGKEALLEILVKVGNARNCSVPVKEIPIRDEVTENGEKININRILDYSRTVWDLYRYGKSSKHFDERDLAEQKRHKSILFLSKAGRFFTVGASGLAINYAVSYLFLTLVPNIWYINATIIGIIVSITTNFLLNKVWTFEDRDFSVRHFFKQYSMFLALCSIGGIVQLTLVHIFVEQLDVQYAVSLVIAVAISSLSNFLLNKKITFDEKIWE